MRVKKIIDKGNLIVIVLTATLFIVALFLKGLSKDLVLEAGVLLVSIKLIMYNYKQSLFDKEVNNRLDEIQKNLIEIKQKQL